MKALVALVVQMTFGSADKAEMLIAELLGFQIFQCIHECQQVHVMYMVLAKQKAFVMIHASQQALRFEHHFIKDYKG